MSAGAGEETTAMEKKSAANRQSSVPPRGQVAESKRTDNGNSTKQNRYNRRREGALPRPRNDVPPRRSNVQKPKTYDKRSRNRGYQGDWQRQEVSHSGGAELGSAQRPGSKKENLNHLLNFTFTPREGETWSGWGARTTQWKGHNRWTGRKAPAFNKEQFLQANCQFVVTETGDYGHLVADPDTLVDWNVVEQVRIYSNDVPSCPICLYPPIAAQITRCGHIYCWSCILHYLSLGEKSWRKCPICYDSIHQKDLKSVMALETHSYAVGENITMKLMKRERSSTYAMPCKQWTPRDGKPHNMADPVDTCYAKLLMASPQQVQDIVDSEMTALECQLQDEGPGTLEASYIESAMDMLKVRRSSLGLTQIAKEDIAALLEKMEVASESEDAKSSPEPTPCPVQKGVNYNDAFDDIVEDSNEAVIDDGAENFEGDTSVVDNSPVTLPAEQVTPNSENEGADELQVGGAQPDDVMEQAVDVEETTEMPAHEDGSPTMYTPRDTHRKKGGTITSTYYYYQAADGQHIYLHSLNARCLSKQYDGWENCPDTITARIVEMEGITMNAELRRRLRCLAHLPLSCEFHVAELALEPPLVSKDTLQFFNDEIEKRRRARQKKSREERKFNKKMQEVEDKRNRKQAGLRVSLGSSVHFPEYGTESTCLSAPLPVPGSGSMNSSAASTPISTPQDSPPEISLNPNAVEFSPRSPDGNIDDPGQAGGAMSFAQMLRAGKTQPTPTWPRTKPSHPVSSSLLAASHGSDSEGDQEDRVPVPDYKTSIGDAFQQALDLYKNAPVEKQEEQNGGKRKKKKKKEMLLFSTTMARSK